MMWVIRAGKNSLYYDKFINESKVFISWDGYRFDLAKLKTRTEYRYAVQKEKETNNRTSISNWAGQLFSFVHEIELGDYILIPSKGSRTYCLGKVVGAYTFNNVEKDKLYHARNISILKVGIPREIFSQSIIYSLGAFRTIFKVKQEDEIIMTIKEWEEKEK